MLAKFFPVFLGLVLCCSLVDAATITHAVSGGLSTASADSLEALLKVGDTLRLTSTTGIRTLGNGLALEKDSLTLILDNDSDRDGIGMLVTGFRLTATGTNTQVRVLQGKNSIFGGTTQTPYLQDNFPSATIGPFSQTTSGYGSYRFAFDLSSGNVELLCLVNSRADMDQLKSVLDAGKGFSLGNTYFSKVTIGYALGANVDMGSTAFGSMGGDAAYPFHGVFDGMGHTLSNLSITGTYKYDGLFSNANLAVLRNLTLSNAQIVGSGAVGGLVGKADSVRVSNVNIQGASIQGAGNVGGIIGWADSITVENSKVIGGSVQGTSNVGGLIGMIYNHPLTGLGTSTSVITQCQNSATITASGSDAGGIIGFAYTNTSLFHVKNRGSITADVSYAGGIAGEMYEESLMTDAVNHGSIQSAGTAGGLIGKVIYKGKGISETVNTGSVTASIAGGIVGHGGYANLLYAYNYGHVQGTTSASGITSFTQTEVRGINYGSITSTTGYAGGIMASAPSNSSVAYLVNLGSVTGKFAAGYSPTGINKLRYALNTGSIQSTTTDGIAAGLATSCSDAMFSLVSSPIIGSNTQAVCSKQYYESTDYNVYNIELAPTASNLSIYNQGATPLDHASLRNFANYPKADSFQANWVAPTTYSIPTPMNLFSSGKSFKKLRQDTLVLGDVDPFSMETAQTYLPTDGSEWTYTCFGRNSKVSCQNSAASALITQAYNVTGAETLVFQAKHSSGFLVTDSLFLRLTIARKSLPEVSHSWPTAISVVEKNPQTIDLAQYFSDADGDALTYKISQSSIVYSELSGSSLSLVFDNKVGTETLTVVGTDASGNSVEANITVTVSAFPRLVNMFPTLILEINSSKTLDLKDYFWDMDGDKLTYSVSSNEKVECRISGTLLLIAMTANVKDSIVVTAKDESGNATKAGFIVVASSYTPTLFQMARPNTRSQITGHTLVLWSAAAQPVQIMIHNSQGRTVHQSEQPVVAGGNAVTLPSLPAGEYMISITMPHARQSLSWQAR